MTRMEAALLEYMARHAGHVCTRADLLRHVWGWPAEAITTQATRTVDVTICKLRKHLPGGAIVTLKGLGYRYVTVPA